MNEFVRLLARLQGFDALPSPADFFTWLGGFRLPQTDFDFV